MVAKNTTTTSKDLESWLKDATLDDVTALKDRLDDIIADKEEKARELAIKAVTTLAEEHGFSVEELFKKRKPQRKKTTKKYAGPVGKILYRDPENPSNGWTGKGPQPKWLKAGIESGKSEDYYKVPELAAAE